MADVTLYLIRHAHAGESQPGSPNDHLRPLSRKGQGQAETLARACARLEVRFHRLFSSPYTRAAETAAPLTKYTRGGRLELLSELTGNDYAGLLTALYRVLGDADTVVGLVGHEPYLGGLASPGTSRPRSPGARPAPGRGRAASERDRFGASTAAGRRRARRRGGEHPAASRRSRATRRSATRGRR